MSYGATFWPNPDLARDIEAITDTPHVATGPQTPFVYLGAIDGPLNAEIARSILEDAGITVQLIGNTAGRVYGFAFGEYGVVRLFVPVHQAEQAHALVQEMDFGSGAA